MFIGRERELKSLEEVYKSPVFGMTVIYGRKRVGKSTLIGDFIRDKKAIFYTATKVGAEKNLELFSNPARTSKPQNESSEVFYCGYRLKRVERIGYSKNQRIET